MSKPTNYKKIEKYLNFQIQRFSRTLGVVEREQQKLHDQNYRDIRTVFAPMEYIEDIVTKDCDQNCITVTFCFGEVENSPVDGFSLAQINELVIFLRNKLSYNEMRLDSLAQEIRKNKKNKTNQN